MGLFRSYAKLKLGKAAFDKAREYWRKRQHSSSKSAPGRRVKSRR